MKRMLMVVIGLLSICMVVKAKEVTLIATGQTYAHFERCGCPDLLQGGLEARAAFLQDTREKEDIILLDMGAFLPKGKENIDSVVGRVYLGAMRELQYDLVLLGESDLTHGYEYLYDLFEAKSIPRPLSSVIVVEPEESFWEESQVLEFEGLKIGFVGASTLNETRRNVIRDFQMLLPEEAIADQVKQLREEDEVDAVVLMVHEPRPVVERWLQRYKGEEIDVILTLDLKEEVVEQEGLFIVNVPKEGLEAGKIVLDVEAAGVNNVRLERIPLKAEEMKNEPMRAYLVSQYEAMVEQLGLQAEDPPLQDFPAERNISITYAGAQECRECHEEQYKQWEETKHAQAFNTLLDQNRHWVPQLQKRYVTGFGSDTGFQSFPKSEYFLHVQCETCHGPGMEHVEGMGTAPIRRGEDQSMCVQCHTSEFTPKFEEMFDLYYKQIQH